MCAPLCVFLNVARGAASFISCWWPFPRFIAIIITFIIYISLSPQGFFLILRQLSSHVQKESMDMGGIQELTDENSVGTCTDLCYLMPSLIIFKFSFLFKIASRIEIWTQLYDLFRTLFFFLLHGSLLLMTTLSRPQNKPQFQDVQNMCEQQHWIRPFE